MNVSLNFIFRGYFSSQFLTLIARNKDGTIFKEKKVKIKISKREENDINKIINNVSLSIGEVKKISRKIALKNGIEKFDIQASLSVYKVLIILSENKGELNEKTEKRETCTAMAC